MKKLAILASALCIFATSGMAVNAAPVAPGNHQPQQMSIEEMMKQRKAHEAAFEQKLGLTEAQKAKAKELRIKGHKKMRPVMEEIKSKKQEAEAIKRSKMAIRMQEEELAKIDTDLKVLEKKAHKIRQQNMKDFESILTKDQKKILNQMKEEGRKNFEKGNCPPPPCP